MPRIVSSIEKHITTTEFWRVLSFILKRLESIAKYLTKLPLPFTFSLYILHLIRASLRIYSYFYKTKNKNLGDTCKLLFAVFKVSIAIIAIILLGCGLVSLPSVLLGSFFAYSILKLIHSSIVLFVSTVSYLKIDRYCIEQQWRRAQYRNNITKHVCMLSAGLLFVLLTCLLNAGTHILIWSNPLLLLADVVIGVVFIAAVLYLSTKIAKNKRIENKFVLRNDQIAKIKKFLLLFGLGIVALVLTAMTPSVGVFAIIIALILLCAQDVLLTIYYYFYGVYVPDPKPANLSEELYSADILQGSRDYYQNFSPVYYLQTQISEKLPQVEDVIKANKKFLLKITLMKLLQLENKLAKISTLGNIGRFFSSRKKLNIKKDYLLRELAWALNTDDQAVLINLFVLAIIDLPRNTIGCLEPKLWELLEILEQDNPVSVYPNRHHPMQENSLGQLFFLAKPMKSLQVENIVKPKTFYQSFWKKVGTCEALSQALQESRKIEEQLSASSLF